MNTITFDTLKSVRTEIAALRTDIELFKRDVATLEQRLTIKLGAFLAVFAGIIITALKAF